MDAAARLTGYVEVWWQAVDDFTTLLEALSADAWATQSAARMARQFQVLRPLCFINRSIAH